MAKKPGTKTSVTKTAAKPRLAFYWAASCGGCEITITELGMRLVDLSEKVDIVFWPAAMDFKYADVEAMPDGHIDFCFFNGAIRNSENEHVAHLLRKKSKTLISFGSCSHLGGIPGLANMFDVETLLERVFDEIPSLDDSRGTHPKPVSKVAEGEIEIPKLYDQVKTLAQVETVDYFMPGCPPVVDQVWIVMQKVLAGQLPPRGAVIGANPKTNCDECPRVKGVSGQRIKEFHRPHEIILDPDNCFLTQGVICCGTATRAGCGLPCIKANMPCRGCYGAPDGVLDQGAKLISAIAALVDTDQPEKITEILAKTADPLGLAYRFGLAGSFLSEMKFKKVNHG
jgi:F420-non-reducing hydrogenase small subunit